MTALDQAFVKAYEWQGAAAARASLAHAKPSPSAEEDSRPADALAASMARTREKEVDTVRKQAVEPPDTHLGEAVEAKTKPANGHARRRTAKHGHTRQTSHAQGHSRKKTDRRDAETVSLRERPIPATYRLAHATTESVGLTEQLARNGVMLASQESPGPTQEMAINGVSLQVRAPSSPAAKLERQSASDAPAAPRPLSVVSPPPFSDLETTADSVAATSLKPAALPAGPDNGSAASGAESLRPLLEVDRFLWPSDCDRLARAATDQLDGLAEQIADEARLGRKTVGVASCRRGDGCTTLVLSVAPRLAAMGLKVLLVDSDFHNPRLAPRLGLSPKSGWEEVLAGHLPLEEVVVESIQDRLALLPLTEPPTGQSYELGGNPRPSASLRRAAEHYELLLVDVGRFSRHDAKGSNLPQPDGRWLESLLLIHNVRSTPQEDLQRNRRRVRDAGIYEMGIVENFA